jgi:transcriptional regulator
MFIPAAFAETEPVALHALMRAHPLATLVIATGDGLDANHIPLHVDSASGEFGTLRGHVSRANPLWRACVEGVPAIAIFRGSDAYITPNWYPSKREDGKAVPTWNYVAVHAHGMLRAIDDAQWLRAQLEELVVQHESTETAAWKISDAPPDYIEAMLRGIVGIELKITRLEGKWKASQNHPAANREGVIEGLRKRGISSASAMAEIVRERGPK